MGAITDLWKSERGLIAALLIIAATVLAGMGQLTFAEWREYTLYIFGTYAITKTVTGAMAIMKGATNPAASSTAVPKTTGTEPTVPVSTEAKS